MRAQHFARQMAIGLVGLLACTEANAQRIYSTQPPHLPLPIRAFRYPKSQVLLKLTDEQLKSVGLLEAEWRKRWKEWHSQGLKRVRKEDRDDYEKRTLALLNDRQRTLLPEIEFVHHLNGFYTPFREFRGEVFVKKLKLTKKQIETIEKAQVRWVEQAYEALSPLKPAKVRGFLGPDFQRRYNQFEKRYETAVEYIWSNVLTTQQTEKIIASRLNRDWIFHHAAVLLRDDIARELQLTRSQRERLQKLVTETIPNNFAAIQRAQKKSLDLLTDSQKKAWKKMLGTDDAK